MTRCTTCLPGITSGPLQLVCEDCRAKRIAECRQQRSQPNYQPMNPACSFQLHSRVLVCDCTPDWFGGKCSPCDHCHWCGEVHQQAA